MLPAFVDRLLTVKFADRGFGAGVIMGVGTGTGWWHDGRGQEVMFQLIVGGGREGGRWRESRQGNKGWCECGGGSATTSGSR